MARSGFNDSQHEELKLKQNANVSFIDFTVIFLSFSIFITRLLGGGKLLERGLPSQRGGPGHARLLQSGSQLLQGPVAAQVALGVRVEALFDPYVRPGLAPQMLGRLGEPGSFSVQRGALHF